MGPTSANHAVTRPSTLLGVPHFQAYFLAELFQNPEVIASFATQVITLVLTIQCLSKKVVCRYIEAPRSHVAVCRSLFERNHTVRRFLDDFRFQHSPTSPNRDTVHQDIG